MFVGVGQSVDANPKTGEVIINGHDKSVQGHHIISVDPFSKTPSKMKSIAKIPAPNVALLGGSSALDWDSDTFFATLVLPKGLGGLPVFTAVANNADGSATVRLGKDGKSISQDLTPEQLLAPPPPAPPFSVGMVAVKISSGKVCDPLDR